MNHDQSSDNSRISPTGVDVDTNEMGGMGVVGMGTQRPAADSESSATGTEGVLGGDPVLDTDVPGGTQGSTVMGDEGMLGGSTPGTMSDSGRYGGDNSSPAGAVGASMGGSQTGALGDTGLSTALTGSATQNMAGDEERVDISAGMGSDEAAMTSSEGTMSGRQGALGGSGSSGSMTSSEGTMSGS